MSYFSRLANSSGLHVAGHRVTVQRKPAENGAGREDDFVDIDAVSETDEALSEPETLRQPAVLGAATDKESVTDKMREAIAETSSAEAPPDLIAEAADQPPDSRTDPPDSQPEEHHTPATIAGTAENERVEAASRPPHTGPAAATKTDHILRQVVDWVAAGPQQETQSPDDYIAAAPSETQDFIEEKTLRRTAQEIDVLQTATDLLPVTGPAEVGMMPIVEVGIEPQTVDSETTNQSREPQQPLEEIINVSIGTISVRVDAPTVPDSDRSPTTPTPVPLTPPAEVRTGFGTRLQRQFLRP